MMSDTPTGNTKKYRERYRQSVKVGSTWHWWNYQNTNNYGTNPSTGEIELTRDFVVKDFFRRKKSGEVIMNEFRNLKKTFTWGQNSALYVQTNVGSTPAQWAREDPINVNYCIQCGNPLATTDVSFYQILSATEANRLASEVSTRVRSQIGRGDTNNWENLAEISKTVQMIQAPVASFWKFNRKAKLLTTGMSAANAWLMYRYGIRPLISSVDGTLKELRKEIRPQRKTTRASNSIAGSSSVLSRFNDGWYEYDATVSKTESLSIRAMSLDTVVGDGYIKYGLDAKSLLTLPWELVPYSFVVDWFLNVGDYLGALSQAFWPQSLGQCQTWRHVLTESRATTAMRKYGTWNVTIYSPRMGWSRLDNVSTNRYPWLSDTSLVLKSDFRLWDVARAADALSLVGQQIGSLFLHRR